MVGIERECAIAAFWMRNLMLLFFEKRVLDCCHKIIERNRNTINTV